MSERDTKLKCLLPDCADGALHGLRYLAYSGLDLRMGLEHSHVGLAPPTSGYSLTLLGCSLRLYRHVVAPIIEDSAGRVAPRARSHNQPNPALTHNECHAAPKQRHDHCVRNGRLKLYGRTIAVRLSRITSNE